MTKTYKTLQSKIHELESIRNDPDFQSHDSDDIKKKLDFAWKIYSAEVQSHPSKPHHLKHISKRLEALEKDFRERDTFSFRTFSEYEEEEEEEECDKDSTCSCTESCLNDDGEALDETDLIGFDDPEKPFPNFNNAVVEFKDVGTEKLGSSSYEDAEEFFEDYVGEKEIVEFKGGLIRKTEEKRRESEFGKKCRAFCCGVVIGMMLMGFIMVNFSGCFYYYEDQESFAFPT